MYNSHSLKPGSTLSEYCIAGKFHSEKEPMTHKRRTIDSFVLLYGISGNVHITDTLREYQLSRDNYLILAANREHYGTKQSPPGVSYYWCHFYIHGEYEFEIDNEQNEYLVFGENGSYRIPIFGKVEQGDKMHSLFSQLIEYSRSPSSFSKPICGNYLEVILSELAYGEIDADTSASSSQEATVSNIIEWIRLNAADIKRVSDISTYFGYNSEYLTTLVKKVTSKSLVDHITESRVKMARKLLRTTDLDIAEIASKCGFSDDKYFFRVFKKLCNMSPGAYRKTYSNYGTNAK